jgi:streptogramin lyase
MPGIALQGMVHGGAQPVVGAQIELFAAGSSGNAQGATALLRTPVFSTAGGAFAITGDYTCPDASSEVYLMALGGNPGLASGTNNTAITLIAPLGQCGNLSASQFYVVNEVTTVATAYALAGFLGSSEAIGSSSTNVTGLQNAFATVNNLVDVHSGTALGITPGGHGVPPQDEINSLADALSACVNTSNDESPTCTVLFNNTTDALGNYPTDVFAAVINLAHDPTETSDPLTSLATANSPFQPTLTAEPTDWSIGIVYLGGGLQWPSSLAIDGLGNIWVSSDPIYQNLLSELSPQGVPISPGPLGFDIGVNYVGPIAIDSKNNIWMPSVPGFGYDISGVVKVDTTGALVSPSPSLNPENNGFAPGILYNPDSIAIDFHDNIWISNGTGVVVELNQAGTLLSPSVPPVGFQHPGYAIAATSQAQGAGIAIDTSNNIWVANVGQDSLVEMNQDGFIVTPPSQGVYGGGLDGIANGNTPPNAVAVDINGSIFTLNSLAGTISEFSSNRVAVSPTGGYAVGGNPPAFCIDSADLMYVSQPSNNSIQVLSALSPAQGFTELINNPEVNGPAGIAVDASGNLWVANFGSGFSGSVTELVGIAFPTKTPIAVANQTESFEP